jgi:hypothetical protein
MEPVSVTATDRNPSGQRVNIGEGRHADQSGPEGNCKSSTVIDLAADDAKIPAEQALQVATDAPPEVTKQVLTPDQVGWMTCNIHNACVRMVLSTSA